MRKNWKFDFFKEINFLRKIIKNINWEKKSFQIKKRIGKLRISILFL